MHYNILGQSSSRSPATLTFNKRCIGMQSALPARFPLADTKCTLSRPPDQEREREPKKSSVYNPHTRLTVAGATQTQTWSGQRWKGATRRKPFGAHTTGGVVTEIMVFRRSALTWRFAPLSRSRENATLVLFFCCGIACAFVFDFVYPLSFEREGRQRQNEAHRHTRNAQRMQIFRVRTGPVSLSMDQHKGTGPAELQVASERSRALSLVLSFAALRAHSSLSRARSAARRRRALEK